MNISRVLTRMLLGLSLGFAVCGAQASGKPLRVVTDPTFPPMEYVQDGKRVGFDIDVGEALAKAMGREIEWIDIDFKGLVPAVQAGRADIALSAIYITEERRKVVDFTDPYYVGGLVVLTKANGPIKRLSDLKGQSVSVQVGTKSVNFLKEHHPDVKRVEVEKNQEMFNLAQIGRSVAAVTGKPAAKLFAQSTKGDMVVLDEQLTNEEYGIAVSKRDPDLLRELNGALAKIKSDGTYDAIVAKWFGAD
ncbi:transporter substrate-binding domain-containing protein [Paracandidimonas soli]|uniref:transporter substrate-binding domain-containing protein n=1 Tax=Paracandidimonas soli TaxID=1917182 RepID=UPI003DA6D5F9